MKDSNPNIKLSYLYRDASNYKLFEEIIFANSTHLTAAEVEKRLRPHLIDEMYFDPNKWKVPVLEFPDGLTEDDHGWHEFEGLEETEEEVTDERRIEEFLNGVRLVKLAN